MKWLTRVPAIVLLLSLLASPGFAQTPADGAWELTVQTPQGDNNSTLTIKLDGDKVTGDLASQLGSTPVTGTLADGNLALVAVLEIQGNRFEIGINGRFQGEALTGALTAGPLGEFPFSGKRAPASSVAAPAGAVSAAPASAASAPSDVSGKWDIVLMIAGMGEFPITATFKQDGANVTGMLSSMAGEVEAKGTITGAALRMEFTVATPNGAVPIVLTGDVGAAGDLTGKATVAGLGQADWKGTRGK